MTEASVFSVDIDILGVTDLSAYQFGLTFDPNVIQAQLVNEGSFLPSGGATFFIPGVIDNSTGRIDFVAGSLLGGLQGVSGSGTLLSVTFAAIAVGSTSVGVTLDPSIGDLLLDSSLTEIAASASGASVAVLPKPMSVPEPSSLALWLVFAVAARRTLRRVPAAR